MTCTATSHHPRKRSSYQSSGRLTFQTSSAVTPCAPHSRGGRLRLIVVGPLATDVPEWVAVKDCGDLRRSGSDVLTATAVGRQIFVVGDGFVPGDAVAVADSFEHGEVAHHIGGCRAVPVVLAGRGVYGVALAHLDDGSSQVATSPMPSVT